MNTRLLLPCLLLTLTACEKENLDPNGLPKATQSGQNTAGWLLDDKAWVPASSSISTGAPVSGTWGKTADGHSLTLSFQQFSVEEDWGLSFRLLDIKKEGTYVLNQTPSTNGGPGNASVGQYTHLRPGARLSYYTGPDAPGKILITRFDTVSNIVAGTFELTPRAEGGGPTIAITQGRFDVHFER